MPLLHLWQADLAAPYPEWQRAEATLAAPEQARQARLRTPALRQTYGRAHGFLRAILGAYTRLPANQLLLTTDLNGKPVLAGSGLHFNLSYRPGRALLAVSDAGAVGVDVEPLAPLPDAAALVKELFSAAEQAALAAAAPAGWRQLFYTIWTRKEAYAKALGMGLATPFAGFSVLAPGADGTPLLTAPARTCLHSFAVGGGYQGAAAVLAPAAPAPQHFSYPFDL